MLCFDTALGRAAQQAGHYYSGLGFGLGRGVSRPVVDHGERAINSMANQVVVSKKKQENQVLTL
jgi:hypothetical protein